MELSQAAALLQKFCGTSLTQTLARIENSAKGLSLETFPVLMADHRGDERLLSAAGLMKRVASQINVVIHSAGILACLPRILEPGEVVEYLSLGAGNTGKKFDLETNKRIAEFKFIHWQGGAETIRQDALFKDFFYLAEHSCEKLKHLFVLRTDHPLKFFKSRRSLSSVLSGRTLKDFKTHFGDRFSTVREYYDFRENAVTIQDVSPWLEGLLGSE